MNKNSLVIGLSAVLLACSPVMKKTGDDGQWLFLKRGTVSLGSHHIKHAELFGEYVSGFNDAILQGIDRVQATARDGGGYFIGKDSIPTESPVGYELKLFGHSLLSPPRTTSYCSGASFAAFIEGINIILEKQAGRLSPERLETIRMQEPDGGRREDHVKFWGWWNADGYGNHFALVQYSGMGTRIAPAQARPGDFMNISWKSGLGHSVIFLGWYQDEQGKRYVAYWSSQRGTNGMGDQFVAIDSIKEVMIVRLTHPEKLFSFDPAAAVNKNISGYPIEW
jgi:hypothetical protein